MIQSFKKGFILVKLVKFKSFFLACLIPLVGLVCPVGVQAESLSVVTSIFPIADMVQQVGATYVDTYFIIPAGASPHTFEPKPSQIRRFSSARVFFMIGAGLEIWAQKFVAAAGRDLLTVTLSDGIPLIRSIESGHLHDNGPAGAGNGSGKQGFSNPHIWLDPVIVRSLTERIVASLSQVDNRHAEDYRRRGDDYIEKLAELDREIRSVVSNFTIQKFVSFHPAWDYFARCYGLESADVIETAPGRDPTPRRIKQIISEIKKHRIRAVFAEPQLNPKVAEVIAREADVRVLFLDPMGAPDIPGRRTYLELMRYNLQVLKEAMQ